MNKSNNSEPSSSNGANALVGRSDVVIQEQKLLKIEDVKKLMYWTAQMTKGMLDSGKSEQDVVDQIEEKYNALVV